MPKGAALSEASSGENISHFAALRVRVVGVGNLKMKAYSVDNVKTKTMVPFALQAVNRIQPTRIVNFVEQRAAFEFKTTEIGERFRVNRIVVYMKELYTSHPGN